MSEIVEGKYEILEKIGESGYESVYKVRHRLLEEFRLIRILRPPTRLKDEFQHRFLSDARAAIRLRHPHIAQLFDFSYTDEGVAYIVMEFLDGTRLDTLLREGPPSIDLTLEISLQALSAIEYLHAHGLVHGDISANNMMLLEGASGAPVLKLIDLGIAKAPWDQTQQTAPDLRAAKFRYSSPEQFSAKVGRAEIDHRSDIYSFGVLLYELLTGEMPITGERFSEIVGAHLFLPPRSFDETDPDGRVVPGLRDVVLSALAKDPETRIASAKEFADRLETFRDPPLRENAQFTVYRPGRVAPEKWYPLLAFAHPAEKPPGAAAEEPDPVAKVEQLAGVLLGNLREAFQPVSQDATRAVPEAGEIVFVPEMDGVKFDPPQRRFRWMDDVHCEKFRLRVPDPTLGHTARGRMAVYLGAILIAEITLAIQVDVDEREGDDLLTSTAQPYRKIFASYSHKDADVVAQVERYARSTGDRYLRDQTELRAGESWSQQLFEMIRQADIFQLFWSWNSIGSAHVRREWEYALELNRPHFIRPTYWQKPLPRIPEKNLPPPELARLHFYRLPRISSAETVRRAPKERTESRALPSPRGLDEITREVDLPGHRRPRAQRSGLIWPALIATIVAIMLLILSLIVD